MTEEQLRTALDVAISALERIKDGDSGPAYHIAKAALEEIKDVSGE